MTRTRSAQLAQWALVLVALVMQRALCVHGVAVDATFDAAVTFGDLRIDPATAMAHIDVTFNIPYATAGVVPFLQVGRRLRAPTPTYTQSADGAMGADEVPCTPAASVPLAVASDFSCATLSRADLMPWECTTDARAVPTTFAQADYFARLRPVAATLFDARAPLAAGGELRVANDTGQIIGGATHYHYDLDGADAPVNGTMYALYCGECLFNSTGCASAAQRRCVGAYAAPRFAPVGGGRAHAAQIVPYATFPAAGLQTWHFQYGLPQLALDCAQNDVTTTQLYDSTSGAPLGVRTDFALQFGLVNRRLVQITDARAYSASLLGGADVATSVAFSVLYTIASQYQVSLTLCGGVGAIYYNATTAALALCYVVRYLNVGNMGTTVGPRVLPTLDAAGAQMGDASSVALPFNAFGTTVTRITPAYDAAAGNAALFCPPTSVQCGYVVHMLTAPQTLTADGLAFAAPPRSGVPGGAGPFDFSFPPYECARGVTPAACAPLFPGTTGNASMHDAFRVTLSKVVLPDASATYIFGSRLRVYTRRAVTFANLLDAACAESPDDPLRAGICASEARVPIAAGARGSVIALLASVANPHYWNNSLGAEEIDADSVVFTVALRRMRAGVLVGMSVEISRASGTSEQWSAFVATWIDVPRVLAAARAAAASPLAQTLAPLARTSPGVDGITVDYAAFFAHLVATRGVLASDLLDTLSVKLRVRYRHLGETRFAAMAATVPLQRARRVERIVGADSVPDLPEDTDVTSGVAQRVSLAALELTCTAVCDGGDAAEDRVTCRYVADDRDDDMRMNTLAWVWFGLLVPTLTALCCLSGARVQPWCAQRDARASVPHSRRASRDHLLGVSRHAGPSAAPGASSWNALYAEGAPATPEKRASLKFDGSAAERESVASDSLQRDSAAGATTPSKRQRSIRASANSN